ncbi:chromosomal replication initiator protein DnaA [Candidatus Saccharibacteria bacterium]|nr:chromosomal replication initiator protein DnaA [Candidatus Saccharibacteria bacterium]
MEERWQAAKSALARHDGINEITFKTFFSRLEFVSVDSGRLTLSAPNAFITRQLTSKYAPIIKSALQSANLGHEIVEYIIAGVSDEQKIERRRKNTTVNTADLTTGLATKPSGFKQHTTNLNPKYLFDNFVVGDNNDLVFAACKAVVANPGTMYNPLYIYGGVGLGKTHLIQAVGNEILRENPEFRILYISIETFYKDFVASLQKKLSGFTEKYRENDVLIIDDMQFLEGKEKSQTEFFHTFNALQQNNKQIIISSDRPPSSIPDLADRLESRCRQGMIIDVRPPDFETRCAILNAKAEAGRLNLSPEVIEFIAEKHTANIRELEGALNFANLLQMSLGSRFSLERLKNELLQNACSVRPRTNPEAIIKATATHFHLTAQEITSDSRQKHVLLPRQIAMYIMKTDLSLSFPQISRSLGRKDHTTAMNGVRKINKMITTDHTLRDHITRIQEVVNA